GIYDWSHENYESAWMISLAGSVLSLFLAVLLAKIPWVQRLFVSAVDRDIQARRRALNEFYEAGLHKTKDSTGILLFISMEDHEAVVLADKSISEKLPRETWNEVVELLLNGAKKKDLTSSFCEAINKCGDLLSPHFPIQPDDVDELKNHLVIRD
ncbi:MAG: TPM domain-containing protein, partial [Bdellovibrionales bacterium]|nr:TPM domain-containing protein [Bdellovibrionales bacterium]